MKVKKCNAGASVKAANGGYMKVQKTGYNKGGAVSSKAKSDQADQSKYAKRAAGVKANKGAAINKAGKAVSFCKGCSTKDKCAANGRCAKTGKSLG